MHDTTAITKGIPMECPGCGATLSTGYVNGAMQLPNFCGECGAAIKLSATGGETDTSKRVTKINDFRQIGHAAEQSGVVLGKAAVEVTKLAEAMVSKREARTVADAIASIFSSRPELYVEYRREQLSARGGAREDDGPEAA